MDKGAIEALNKQLAILMLEVILGKDKESISAKINQWDREVIIDEIDYGVMKLVPLFLKKTKDFQIPSIHEKRLKVLHKYWWLKTLKNLDRLKEVVDLLVANSIEVMLIKGVPVLPFYSDSVYRPMADLDILIPKRHVLESIQLLEQYGWKCTNPSFLLRLRKAPSLCMDFEHSIELAHPVEATKMDLHWKVGNYASWELTEHVWKTAQFSQQFPSAKSPELSNLLCMSILHSVDSESKHHYNWIVDVAYLMGSLSNVHWEKAAALAKHEQKDQWFGYGCFLLGSLGVHNPFDAIPYPSPKGRLTKEEFGSRYNLPLYVWKKVVNVQLMLQVSFPHDHGLQKFRRFCQRVAYLRLNRMGLS
jgi:hypothetical protein